jgi:hypothetical protein
MRKLSDKKRELLMIKQHIITGYESNWSLRDLAKAYDSSVGSIRNLLIEEGVTLRKQGRQKKEDK